MADPLLNSYSGLNITIQSVVGNKYDITANVTELSIFESIDSFYLMGEMTMFDDSALMSRVPLVGQETVIIKFTKESVEIEISFLITDIHDIARESDEVAGFTFTLTDALQFKNSTATFSRAFSGTTDTIIGNIHQQYLGRRITVVSESATSHNIVFPWIKPYKAISMLLRTTAAVDGSPYFLYSTLWNSAVTLQSMNDMFDTEPEHEIKELKMMNLDTQTGSTVRGIHEFRTNIYDIKIDDSSDTLKLVANGSYAANTTMVDVATKSISNTTFDYRKYSKDERFPHLSDNYKVGESKLNEHSNSKHYALPHNSMAFDSSLTNLSTQSPLDIMGNASYGTRFKSHVISVHADAIPYLQSGHTIDLKYRLNTPKLGVDHEYDSVNSGTYVVGSIRHHFTGGEKGSGGSYKMVLELIRDGIGVKHES